MMKFYIRPSGEYILARLFGLLFISTFGGWRKGSPQPRETWIS